MWHRHWYDVKQVDLIALLEEVLGCSHPKTSCRLEGWAHCQLGAVTGDQDQLTRTGPVYRLLRGLQRKQDQENTINDWAYALP